MAQWDVGAFNVTGLVNGGVYPPQAGSELLSGAYGMARVGYRF